MVDGYPPPDITLPPGVAERTAKYYIKGKPVTVLAERVEYLDENGKLVTESPARLQPQGHSPALRQPRPVSASLARPPSARRPSSTELAAEGLLLEPLLEEVGKDLDPFDLICHIAFDQPPLTRRERADNVRKRDVFTQYGPQARAVLEALLAKYQDEGIVTGLDDTRMLEIPPFNSMGTPIQLIKPFGTRSRL